jgi:hypothetical protein
VGKKEDQHILDTEECKSCFVRNSTYRDQTKVEAWMKDEEVSWQAHHILCNHSVSESNMAAAIPKEDLLFAKAVLWITDWDLNNSHNMVGLPTNWQYRDSDGQTPVNLPSHQVDHNTTDGYTDECTDWLKTNVWDKIKDKGKDHQANAENMKTLLKSGTDHFLGQLQKRGIRPNRKGTAYCWSHRCKKAPPDATAAEKKNYKQEPKWYSPFSMARDRHVNERSPGVDWKSTQSALAEVLKKIG